MYLDTYSTVQRYLKSKGGWLANSLNGMRRVTLHAPSGKVQLVIVFSPFMHPRSRPHKYPPGIAERPAWLKTHHPIPSFPSSLHPSLHPPSHSTIAIHQTPHNTVSSRLDTAWRSSTRQHPQLSGSSTVARITRRTRVTRTEVTRADYLVLTAPTVLHHICIWYVYEMVCE